jgi:D-glycero-beta-D-manno-heptose-7-phosphate kinase
MSRFSKSTLLVVGDLMVDRYIRGHVNRLSPEAPVPVVDVKQEEFMPGGSGNVVSNIVALGGKAVLISVVGQDLEGEQLVAALRNLGVDVEGVGRDSGRPTIQKTRVIAGHQQVVRFDRESRNSLTRDVLDLVLAQVRNRLPEADGIVLSDYGKGIIGPYLLKNILTLARRYGKFVTVDPKIEHFQRYRGVDCITPNLKEATEGMRTLPPKNDEEVDELGRRILKRLRCRAVLITRGERGMSLYQSSGSVSHIPAQAQEVFDVTGAGDTVIATLSLALAAGYRLDEAARIANLAAGVVVAKLGTATVRPEEIRAAMEHWTRPAAPRKRA